MKFHNISDLESMMIEIQNNSLRKMLEYFDTFSNPFERIEQRKLYFKALRKLKRRK